MTAAELKARFPWIGTDEEVSGSDVINALNQWYAQLAGTHCRCCGMDLNVGHVEG